MHRTFSSIHCKDFPCINIHQTPSVGLSLPINHMYIFHIHLCLHYSMGRYNCSHYWRKMIRIANCIRCCRITWSCRRCGKFDVIFQQLNLILFFYDLFLILLSILLTLLRGSLIFQSLCMLKVNLDSICNKYNGRHLVSEYFVLFEHIFYLW